MKLARGHAAYELSQPQLGEPIGLYIQPLESLAEVAKSEFERAGAGELKAWPELGSRAFMRACGAYPHTDTAGPWIIVQSGRYRYSVDEPGGVVVRLVIGEYLACQVEWE